MDNFAPVGTTAAGSSEMMDAAVINVSNKYFSDEVSNNRVSGLIDEINLVTEAVGREVVKYNGRLLCVTRSGIAAMFGDDCDAAIQCAITICQNAEFEERQSLFGDLSVGVDYGTLCVGLVGFNGFSMPLVLSESMDTAVFLGESARRYNAKILVTNAAVSRVNHFQMRYNHRRLGRIFHTTSGEAEDFFDVFDGDQTETKYSKMRSRLFFETGVSLFLKGSYLEARSYFIELLKFDRNDAAAKQYIYKCDSLIAGAANDTEMQYLAVR